VRRSEEEIAALHEQATARMHALQADFAAIADERRTLLDGLEQISTRLAEIVATGDRSTPDELDESPTPEPDLAAAAGPASERTDGGAAVA
jgi:hypothetical protein